MIRRAFHVRLLPAALAALAVCAVPAGAQSLVPPPPPDSTSPAAVFARHGWAEAGIGWIGSPAATRRRFEAGQGFAAGLEARPAGWLRLRGGADFQTLTANSVILYEQTSGVIDEVTDSLAYQAQSRAWWLALRGETGVRAPGGVWLFAGATAGFFNGGMDPEVQHAGDVTLRVQQATADGFAWSASLGVARSLQPLLPWPVGLDLRWRRFRRGDESFEPWSVRAVWMRR